MAFPDGAQKKKDGRYEEDVYKRQSTDIPGYANIISFMRGLLLIIPMAFLLSVLFDETGLWLAFPATELAVAVIGVVLYNRGKRIWKKHF